jgi:hypothetical protein
MALLLLLQLQLWLLALLLLMLAKQMHCCEVWPSLYLCKIVEMMAM